MVTVFTPTYNRAHTLPRLFKSLCCQTCFDFEWLIVDDGSTDGTSDFFDRLINEEHSFKIRYIKQQNGGKHRAINRGVKEALGELFFIVDSDDQLTENAISFVSKHWSEIAENDTLAGLSGVDMFADGTIVGGESDFDVFDANSLDARIKYGLKGDLAEVFKTQVLRRFPFPEFEGEKFCPEDLVWNRIGKDHELRYYNIPIYICEYQPDGLTAKIAKVRKYSPVASMTYYSEYSRFNLPFFELLKTYINFWRFTPAKYFMRGCKMIGALGFFFLPFGWAYRLKEIRL